MTPAAAAILEGMPSPRLLHRAEREGTTCILAGPVVLACYPSGEAGRRNVAEAGCRATGHGEPFVTVDGVRMARKTMYFSSAKAESALGYHARPATEALADAVTWFRGNGYLR